MGIAYFHASEFGNGVRVAEEFKRIMATKGISVNIQHMRDARPAEMPPADLYVFSSPGRYGKPIKIARKFLGEVKLPPGIKYAVLTTEMAPKPDRNTGKMPTEEEMARWQRVRPVMNELLQAKGLIKAAEDKVYVAAIKGPLEDGWPKKVEAFANQLASSLLLTA